MPGRDHYPKAWTAGLAGGGVKAGLAVGRTDKQGGTVEDGRVGAVDFMATVCKAMEIDYKQEFYASAGRPLRIVDKDENAVMEQF